MWRINRNGIVTMNRGECFSAPLFINQGTIMDPNRFLIKERPGTKVYFGVMEANQPFENAIIRKMYDDSSTVNEDGDLIITFSANDTINLRPGVYYYSIKVLVDGLFLSTILSETPFQIM